MQLGSQPGFFLYRLSSVNFEQLTADLRCIVHRLVVHCLALRLVVHGLHIAKLRELLSIDTVFQLWVRVFECSCRLHRFCPAHCKCTNVSFSHLQVQQLISSVPVSDIIVEGSSFTPATIDALVPCTTLRRCVFERIAIDSVEQIEAIARLLSAGNMTHLHMPNTKLQPQLQGEFADAVFTSLLAPTSKLVVAEFCVHPQCPSFDSDCACGCRPCMSGATL